MQLGVRFRELVVHVRERSVAFAQLYLETSQRPLRVHEAVVDRVEAVLTGVQRALEPLVVRFGLVRGPLCDLGAMAFDEHLHLALGGRDFCGMVRCGGEPVEDVGRCTEGLEQFVVFVGHVEAVNPVRVDEAVAAAQQIGFPLDGHRLRRGTCRLDDDDPGPVRSPVVACEHLALEALDVDFQEVDLPVGADMIGPDVDERQHLHLDRGDLSAVASVAAGDVGAQGRQPGGRDDLHAH